MPSNGPVSARSRMAALISSTDASRSSVTMRSTTVPDGSVVDLIVTLDREASVEEINAAMRERADTGPFEGILQYTEDPIVSQDVVGSTYSSVFDAGLTMTNGRMAKVVAWY